MLDTLDLNSIQDEHARQCIRRLLNLVDELTQENRAQREELQRLRDEIQRLKGEQGMPTIKANTPKPPAPDYSSEPERHPPRTRGKRGARAPITVDRDEVLPVDPATLPPDAEFKGYDEVIVQDLVVRTDNVRFHKEKFYSPSEGKTYLAELPSGYRGEFGPGVRALALVFYFACQMSEPKIVELFHHVGVQISEGEI